MSFKDEATSNRPRAGKRCSATHFPNKRRAEHPTISGTRSGTDISSLKLRQATLNYAGKGFSWFANYARLRLFIIDLRYSPETQNPSEAIPWGFDSPSRHHLKYQYPMWNHRLAALVSALCFACFRVDPALRYEFRYSAHPLSFQYLGSACGGLDFCRLSLFTPDYGMRSGLGNRSVA